MKTEHEVLFTPWQVGGITVRNRFVHCPMEGTNIIETVNFKFAAHSRDYWLERARNDVGLLIPGMVPIRSFLGGKWLYQYEKLFMGPVKQLMDDVHRYGARFFLQIGAGMGRSMAAIPMLRSIHRSAFLRTMTRLAGFDVERMFAAPSAGLPNVWDPAIKTTALATHDIHAIVDAYGRAALLCQKAGIDGVEIHALHEGYLLDQFAMTATNQRTDEYGGSLENRLRFVTGIIHSVKAACGPDYLVSVRYSVESKMIAFNVGAVPGEHYHEFGRGRDESIQVARLRRGACHLAAPRLPPVRSSVVSELHRTLGRAPLASPPLARRLLH